MAKYRGKYAYLGAWHYVLLDILYAIPLIGLIFLLIHSFDANNENRLHYARSYFVRCLLALICLVIFAGIFYLVVGSEAFMAKVNEISMLMTNYFKTLTPPPQI